MVRNVHKSDKRFFSHENSPFILFLPIAMEKKNIKGSVWKNLLIKTSDENQNEPVRRALKKCYKMPFANNK